MEHISDNKRIVGIDLLRIISMTMIIVLHMSGRGGLLETARGIYANNSSSDIYWIVCIIRTFCFCGVNCFAIISGYVGIHSKHIYSSICLDYLRVLFYSIGITILFSILYPGFVDDWTWKRAIFPITHSEYWYFTSYFGLIILAPILNKGICAINKKQLELVIVMLFLLFSMLPMIFQKEYFNLNDGYSMLWLIFMYLVGACLRECEETKLKTIQRALLFAIYFVSAIIAFVLSWLTETERIYTDANCQIGYTNPFIVFCAISLFLAIKDIKVSVPITKVITFFAPLTFSVYLIHAHPLVLAITFNNTFSFMCDRSILRMSVDILIYALLIFAFCSLLDLPRHIVELKLGIRRKIVKIEEKLY